MVVEFAPTTFQMLAGLVCWYDTDNHYYLAITRDEALGRCLRLFVTRHGVLDEMCQPIALPAEGRIVLESVLSGVVLRFWYAVEGGPKQPIGPECDATILSDECAPEPGGFTGAFVGMAVHDIAGVGAHADFDYFLYEEV
jgi:xylan 1,4-beta-xylosidase